MHLLTLRQKKFFISEEGKGIEVYRILGKTIMMKAKKEKQLLGLEQEVKNLD